MSTTISDSAPTTVASRPPRAMTVQSRESTATTSPSTMLPAASASPASTREPCRSAHDPRSVQGNDARTTVSWEVRSRTSGSTATEASDA